MKYSFRRWAFGLTRYCHPVHQIHIHIGFIHLWWHVERELTQAEWGKCPAWIGLQEQFRTFDKPEQSPFRKTWLRLS
jgi:hypothetical protein